MVRKKSVKRGQPPGSIRDAARQGLVWHEPHRSTGGHDVPHFLRLDQRVVTAADAPPASARLESVAGSGKATLTASSDYPCFLDERIGMGRTHVRLDRPPIGYRG
jgi:hypothetical protein